MITQVDETTIKTNMGFLMSIEDAKIVRKDISHTSWPKISLSCSNTFQNNYPFFLPVDKSSAFKSKNRTGMCSSMPSGASQSAGAPGTPDPGAGTITNFLSSVKQKLCSTKDCSRSNSVSVFADLFKYFVIWPSRYFKNK